jgi:hypothetical protein
MGMHISNLHGLGQGQNWHGLLRTQLARSFADLQAG